MLVVLVRVQMTGRVLVSTRVSDRHWVCCAAAEDGCSEHNPCISLFPCSSHPFPSQLTKHGFGWPWLSSQRHPGRCSLCWALTQGVLGRAWRHHSKWPAPKRGCHLLLSLVGNTSEPTFLAAAWGSQFQRLQCKVESFFPVTRLVDTQLKHWA